MRGPVKILPHPAAPPGRTVWGKTQGPVAFVGYVEQPTGNFPGIACFLDERESRQLLLAWGWPLPEAHADLEEKLALALETIERLQGELDVARENQVQVVPIRELSGVLGAMRRDNPEAPPQPLTNTAA